MTKVRYLIARVLAGSLLLSGFLGLSMPVQAASSRDVSVRTYILNPPNAVTDLSASPVGMQDGDVQLTWTAPKNINGARISHYLIRYATFGATSQALAENWWAATSMTETTVSPAQLPGVQEFTSIHNLPLGTMIYFGIKSVDVDKQISSIDVRTGTLGQAKTMPLSVNSNPAPNTPTNFAGVALTTTSIRWTWDDTTFASFYTLNSYPSGNLITQTTGLMLLETGLIPNFALVRTVRAGNGGGLSAPTAAQTIYTLAAVPSAVAIQNVGFTSIKVGWNSSGNAAGTQYRVERSQDGINFVVINLVSTTTFTDSGLQELTSYYYRIRAINGDGIQTVPSVAASTFTPLQLDFMPPNSPMGLKGALDVSGNVFTLSWEDVLTNADGTPCTDLKGYEVYRRTSLLGAATKLTAVPIQVTAFADNVSNQTYYYTIRAVDSSGNVSENSLFADSSLDANIIYLSSDSISTVVMPQSVNDLLRSGFNTISVPLTIRMQETPVPSTNEIIRQVEFSLVRADTGQQVKGLAFSRPQAIVGLGYNLANGYIARGAPLNASVAQAPAAAAVTSALPTDLSLYFNNGVNWVKVGGTLDLTAQAVKTRTSYLGLYQLRIAARATSLDLSPANVFPRVFSPNGDGFNDRVYFVLENPNDVSVSGEIFDMAGRSVTVLAPPSSSSGIGTTLQWDGKDRNGARVTSGVYYYKIQGESKAFTGTVVVAR